MQFEIDNLLRIYDKIKFKNSILNLNIQRFNFILNLQ